MTKDTETKGCPDAPVLNPPAAFTDDEINLLRAFVGSAIFPVYKKLAESELASLYRQLETAQDQVNMFRIQGRINGVRFMLNAPGFVSGVAKLR